MGNLQHDPAGAQPWSRTSGLAALTLALLAAPVQAQIRETLGFANYPVPAGHAVSLGRTLNANSPIHHGGLTYHAYTTWTVNWAYRWTQSIGYCQVNAVTTHLDSTIQLPRLDGGSSNLHRQFDHYLEALRQHELGHYQIGRMAAQQVDRQLRALPIMADCQRLNAAANHLAHQIVEHYREEERTYDRVTIHGQLQGARLDL